MGPRSCRLITVKDRAPPGPTQVLPRGAKQIDPAAALTRGPVNVKTVGMWRAIICLCAALIVGVPRPAAAQIEEDKQNPSEYTDEDSQPLRMLAYFVAPIGFLLEWGVARPLHYLATDTFLAPAMNAETREPTFTPPAIAEIPLDNVGDEPPRPSRFSGDVRTKSPEDTRQPSTGTGAPTGAGTEIQAIIH
jgi:hypothetical protein